MTSFYILDKSKYNKIEMIKQKEEWFKTWQ